METATSDNEVNVNNDILTEYVRISHSQVSNKPMSEKVLQDRTTQLTKLLMYSYFPYHTSAETPEEYATTEQEAENTWMADCAYSYLLTKWQQADSFPSESIKSLLSNKLKTAEERKVAQQELQELIQSTIATELKEWPKRPTTFQEMLGVLEQFKDPGMLINWMTQAMQGNLFRRLAVPQSEHKKGTNIIDERWKVKLPKWAYAEESAQFLKSIIDDPNSILQDFCTKSEVLGQTLRDHPETPVAVLVLGALFNGITGRYKFTLEEIAAQQAQYRGNIQTITLGCERPLNYGNSLEEYNKSEAKQCADILNTEAMLKFGENKKQEVQQILQQQQTEFMDDLNTFKSQLDQLEEESIATETKQLVDQLPAVQSELMPQQIDGYQQQLTTLQATLHTQNQELLARILQTREDLALKQQQLTTLKDNIFPFAVDVDQYGNLIETSTMNPKPLSEKLKWSAERGNKTAAKEDIAMEIDAANLTLAMSELRKPVESMKEAKQISFRSLITANDPISGARANTTTTAQNALNYLHDSGFPEDGKVVFISSQPHVIPQTLQIKAAIDTLKPSVKAKNTGETASTIVSAQPVPEHSHALEDDSTPTTHAVSMVQPVAPALPDTPATAEEATRALRQKSQKWYAGVAGGITKNSKDLVAVSLDGLRGLGDNEAKCNTDQDAVKTVLQAVGSANYSLRNTLLQNFKVGDPTKNLDSFASATNNNIVRQMVQHSRTENSKEQTGGPTL